MSGEMAEQMIDDAITYGTGFYGYSHDEVYEYYELENPYSWSIKYFDDWRCVVDYLREMEKGE